ncbi:MAG: phosphotransferase [Desulfohalobiaceae bacterium]|nr:phosphotransferase [Desulfohalobiaceae bacterium]
MSFRHHSRKIKQIKDFLASSNWVDSLEGVSFLAAGEYNENYLIAGLNKTYVFRINQGSQLGLGDRQIEYEYRVLKALASSGVTPKPVACEPYPKKIQGGVLLMEYLPGKPLDYEQDLEKAARVFARVHTASVPEGLMVQPDPVLDISRECHGLIHRYADHPLHREKEQILDYYQAVQGLAAKSGDLFENENMCLVNTEVNSGNFLIGESGAYLVDWEKAVVSCRYQDLGHFLVPTTTLWKSDHLLSQLDKTRFLEAYREAAGLDLDLEELWQKTRVLEKTILLRALSWCFMAYYEYTMTDRPIQNQDTFAKIKQYLSDIPWILRSVA